MLLLQQALSLLFSDSQQEVFSWQQVLVLQHSPPELQDPLSQHPAAQHAGSHVQSVQQAQHPASLAAFILLTDTPPITPTTNNKPIKLLTNIKISNFKMSSQETRGELEIISAIGIKSLDAGYGITQTSRSV